MSKKVLLVIASDGYQPIEYKPPKRLLAEAGFIIITVSDQPGTAKAAYDNSETKVDVVLEQINMADYDALYFIGGSGALEHLDNEKSYQLLQQCQASGKPYGAICVSPRILAKAGVLKNKKATGWNGDGKLESILTENGAVYIAENVVVDDNVITASGPEAAEGFAKAILRVLS